jgi:hypothetical protein
MQIRISQSGPTYHCPIKLTIDLEGEHKRTPGKSTIITQTEVASDDDLSPPPSPHLNASAARKLRAPDRPNPETPVKSRHPQQPYSRSSIPLRPSQEHSASSSSETRPRDKFRTPLENSIHSSRSSHERSVQSTNSSLSTPSKIPKNYAQSKQSPSSVSEDDEISTPSSPCAMPYDLGSDHEDALPSRDGSGDEEDDNPLWQPHILPPSETAAREREACSTKRRSPRRREEPLDVATPCPSATSAVEDAAVNTPAKLDTDDDDASNGPTSLEDGYVAEDDDESHIIQLDTPQNCEEPSQASSYKDTIGLSCLELHQELCHLMLAPLSDDKKEKLKSGTFGCVYILENTKHMPGHWKIGTTDGWPADRALQWTRSCGVPINLHYFSPSVKVAKRAEELCHIHLRHFNKMYDCRKCKTTNDVSSRHMEYFKLPYDVAQRYVLLWSKFLHHEPYDRTGKLNKFWIDRLASVWPPVDNNHGDHEEQLQRWTSFVELKSPSQKRAWKFHKQLTETADPTVVLVFERKTYQRIWGSVLTSSNNLEYARLLTLLSNAEVSSDFLQAPKTPGPKDRRVRKSL